MGFLFMFTLGASRPVLSIVPVDIQRRHLLRGGAIPLRDGGRGAVAAFAASILAAEVDRRMYHRRSEDPLLLTLVFFNMIFSCRLPGASPACRGASRTIP